MEPSSAEITRLLAELRGGNSQAAEQLMPLVYNEMRRMARRHFSQERRDHTLEPTALVHEAYLRLIKRPGSDWKDRGHFFACAAQAMRRILVDHARAHNADKRGRGIRTLTLDGIQAVSEEDYPQILQLDAALCKLQSEDPRQRQIVELRFFGGLNEQEIAVLLRISVRTVKRDWQVARAWLHREMTK